MAIADFFKPREVKWTLRALDEALRDAPSQLHDHRHIIRSECRQLIRKADQTTYAIRVDGHTPMQLALFLATGVAKELLLSGQFHIYRGILSDGGHGLKRILRHLLNLQVDAEIISADDMREILDFVDQEVSEVG